LGAAFYTAILQAKVVTVSGPSVAEATKMLENVFRYVNIALVNELAVLHEILGVDFIEAIDAAATKPFGFMAHYPGPGVGGHCIPNDPFVGTIKVGSVQYTSTGSLLDSVKGVDAVVIATNHAAFRQVDLSEVKAQMNPDPVLFDTRNLRTRAECEGAGFTYLATGRP